MRTAIPSLILLIIPHAFACAATNAISGPVQGRPPEVELLKIISPDDDAITPYDFGVDLTYKFNDVDGDQEDGTTFQWWYKAKQTSQYVKLGTQQQLGTQIPVDYGGGTIKACVTPKTNSAITYPYQGLETCAEKPVRNTNYSHSGKYSSHQDGSLYPGYSALYDSRGNTNVSCPSSGTDANPTWCERYLILDNSASQTGVMLISIYSETNIYDANYQIKLDGGNWSDIITKEKNSREVSVTIKMNEPAKEKQKVWIRVRTTGNNNIQYTSFGVALSFSIY